MASKTGKKASGLAVSLVALSVVFGCSTAGESGAVLRVGSRNLRCPAADLETALNRESAKVREYYVGCEFMYTRVLCDKGTGQQASACHPAKPQPPCFGGGCFTEDPVTFEWTLDESLASAEPAPTAESLFATP